MTTLDTTFLIIAAVAVSLFFLLLAGLIVYVFITYRRIVKKAETALETVEAATHMIRDVGTKTSAATIFKVIRYIIRLSR